VSCQRL